MPVVPSAFSNAETDHPAVAQWCSTVLAGDVARLLLLGLHWSGDGVTVRQVPRRLRRGATPLRTCWLGTDSSVCILG